VRLLTTFPFCTLQTFFYTNTNSISKMFRSAALLLTLVSSASASFEGATCGITSADFFRPDFQGEFLVSGQAGCSLAGEGTEKCYCAPSYGDDTRLSEWTWQCEGSSEKFLGFGPVEGKTCPEKMPVDKENSLEGTTCDTSMHPSGQADDPVCPYSTCDEGGSDSSICACIDMEEYGLGEGTQWVCLHSTCDCPAAAVGASTGNVAGIKALPFLMVGAAIVGL
jgi:hypothetical protein